MLRAGAVAIAVLVVLTGCLSGVQLEDRSEHERTATVTDVIDGDTVAVRFSDGSTDTVRLLGVDTPEVHVSVSTDEFEGIPDSEAGRSWLREWGERASAFVTRRVGDEQVEIHTDPAADRRGSYDRLLAYVVVDGTNLNRQLLERGYARMYDSEFSRRAGFAAAEATAREEGRGVWGFEPDGTAIARPDGPAAAPWPLSTPPANRAAWRV